MSPRRSFPLEKKWNPLFSQKPQLDLRKFYLQNGVIESIEGEQIDTRIQGDSQEFCAGPGPEVEAAAWLDDRAFPTSTDEGGSRKYGNRLSPRALRAHLDTARFDSPNLPNVERRLAWFKNINLAYGRTLFETAPPCLEKCLKDAMQRHRTNSTCMRVILQSYPKRIFQLDLHLPFITIRDSATPSTICHEDWKDVSFLHSTSSAGRKFLCRAHFSLVIFGLSDKLWDAYAFDKNYLDNKDSENGECQFHADPISLDDLDADMPLWNQRQYFLAIFARQIHRAHEELRKALEWVEARIRNYREQHLFTLSPDPQASKKGTEEMKKKMKDSCRSIIKAMGILDWLEECIEEIMKEWERFEGDNGDMQYFSHFDDEDDDASENLQRHIQRSLIAIKRELEDFSYLRRTLLRLQRYCRESSEDIKFWLKLRSDDAAVQTSEAAQRNIRYTAFMNMVITPIMLVTTSFSMPQSVIPFKLNLKSFVISIVIIAAGIQLASVGIDLLLNWWHSVTPTKTLREIGTSAPKRFRIASMSSRGCCTLDGMEPEEDIEEV